MLNLNIYRTFNQIIVTLIQRMFTTYNCAFIMIVKTIQLAIANILLYSYLFTRQ